jgi:hypothetical protein
MKAQEIYDRLNDRLQIRELYVILTEEQKKELIRLLKKEKLLND